MIRQTMPMARRARPEQPPAASLPERAPHLVAYDIASPKRWRRLFRGLRKVAIPIQYSLFYGEFTPAGLARVVALVEEVIDPRSDDVRIYPLPRGGWQARIGRPILPEGIGFTGLPPAFRGPAGPPAAAPPVPADGAAGRPFLPGMTARRPTAAETRRRRAIESLVQTGQRRGITLL